MAEENSGSNALTSGPVIGLLVLLVILIVGFAGNIYLLTAGGASQAGTAAKLDGVVQSIAKNAEKVAGGDASVVSSLNAEKEEFDRLLAEIRGSAPQSAQGSVGQITSLWSDII